MTPGEKKINDSLTAIWEKYVTTGQYKTDYAPLYRTALRHNALLFVGLNPSFITGHPSIKNYGYNGRSGKDAFLWDPKWSLNTDPKRIDSLANHERKVSTPSNSLYYKKYFSIFETIRNELVETYPDVNDIDWEYSDIFFFREKDQKNALSLIYTSASKGTAKTLTPFVKAQLEVFKQLVCAINPRAIIMNNALASHIVLDRFTVSKFDTAAGCYWWEECGGEIPLFARGTMQYGRLDKYEKERLVWHIARTI